MSKQMTREEAIEAIRGVHKKHGISECRSIAELMIDRFVAIGVFTPAEPKAIVDDLVVSLPYERSFLRAIVDDLADAGFKIVKA